MFYELQHSLAADYFRIERDVNFSYPAHMHHCYELLCLLEGAMTVIVDGREYNLKPGGALLIFSNQVHSMKTADYSRHILCLFSPKLISAYSSKTTSSVPVDNYFEPDEFYVKRLDSFGEDASVIEIKGLLYSFCGLFDKNAAYRSSESSSEVLLYRIFKFIEDNYGKNCSLSDLSKHTGYEYTYLSRYFKQMVGISFNDYVNEYRISKVCYLLQNGDMTVLEISNECGFNSLRTLNRNFKEQIGIPPAEYRRRQKNRMMERQS